MCKILINVGGNRSSNYICQHMRIARIYSGDMKEMMGAFRYTVHLITSKTEKMWQNSSVTKINIKRKICVQAGIWITDHQFSGLVLHQHSYWDTYHNSATHPSLFLSSQDSQCSTNWAFGTHQQLSHKSFSFSFFSRLPQNHSYVSEKKYTLHILYVA